MRKLVISLGLFALMLATGCGGSASPKGPLTDDEKQKVKAEDRKVDDDERSGSGTATKPKKR